MGSRPAGRWTWTRVAPGGLAVGSGVLGLAPLLEGGVLMASPSEIAVRPTTLQTARRGRRPHGEALEGDVVLGLGQAHGTAFFRRRTAGVTARPTEELHSLGRHFERGARGPLRGVPDAWVAVVVRIQPALDQHLAPLAQILVRRFGLFAPHRDAEPDRLLHLVAGVVSVGAVGRHVKIGDGLATGRVAHLRIAPEVANEDDFVKHGDSPYQWGSRFVRPGRPSKAGSSHWC